MKSIPSFILFTFSILIFPPLLYSQAPNLGVASGFALFTSVGAFTNVGTSVITGDAGTNVGAFTGFPPGVVTGVIHVVDPTSAQAAIDVDVAYSFLSGLSCDSTIGTTLGNNQVLPPRTYCIGSVSVCNGDLILDGQGDPNALFIFKIDAALSTNPFFNIILINSATVDNVYWQVNGTFIMGDSSSFQGTVLVNGAISITNGAILSGRGLSRAGAINISNSIVTLFAQSNPLPIELLYFQTINTNSYNLVSWATETETNNDYFTLERTNDGMNFSEVARVSGSGTSSLTNYYSYVDYNYDNTINYYRLTQTDYNGQSQTFYIIIIDNTVTILRTIKIINILGQVVNSDYEKLRFIYYENGTMEKKSGK